MHYFMETKTITYKGTRETGNETKQMKEMKKKVKDIFLKKKTIKAILERTNRRKVMSKM